MLWLRSKLAVILILLLVVSGILAVVLFFILQTIQNKNNSLPFKGGPQTSASGEVENTSFEFISQLPNYKIKSDSVDTEWLKEALTKLEVWPTKNEGFIGEPVDGVWGGQDRTSYNPTKIRVFLLPISQLEEDQQSSSDIAARRLYSRAAVDGNIKVTYLAGKWFAEDSRFDFVVYVDPTFAQDLGKPIGDFLNRVALEEIFLNFQSRPLNNFDLLGKIYEKLGQDIKPIFKIEETRSTFNLSLLITKVLGKIVKTAYAQQCTGSPTCGNTVSKYRCSGGTNDGKSCEFSTDCPGGSCNLFSECQANGTTGSCFCSGADCGSTGSNFICLQTCPCVVSGGCSKNPIQPPSGYCGDRSCNGSETCSTCSSDCGSCPPAGGCTDGYCVSNSAAPDGYIDNCGEIGKAEGSGTCSGGRCCQPTSGSGCGNPNNVCSFNGLYAVNPVIPPGGSTQLISRVTFFDGRCPFEDNQDFLGFHITSNNPSVAYLSNSYGRNFYNYRARNYGPLPNYFHFEAVRFSPTQYPVITVPANAPEGATTRITALGVAEHIYTNVPTALCSRSITVTVAPTYRAWWRAIDGDVLAVGNLTSPIPSTCVLPTCNPAFSLKPAYTPGFPGIPIYGGITYDFSASNTSQGIPAEGTKPWIANSRPSAILSQYNYTYFRKQIPPNVPLNEGRLSNNQLSTGNLHSGQAGPRNYVWYKTTGDTSIQGNIQILGDDRFVLLVEGGDLTINGTVDIDIPGRGFFMAVVNGDIIIDPAISDQAPDIEGLYLADGTFTTGTTGAKNDKQFTLRGAVAAHGGISLQRDRGSTLNQTTPAEVFEYAPELIGAFPREFFRDKIIWQEVAP